MLGPTLSSTIIFPLFTMSSNPVVLVAPSLGFPHAWNNWGRRKWSKQKRERVEKRKIRERGLSKSSNGDTYVKTGKRTGCSWIKFCSNKRFKVPAGIFMLLSKHCKAKIDCSALSSNSFSSATSLGEAWAIRFQTCPINFTLAIWISDSALYTIFIGVGVDRTEIQ